MNDKIRPEQWPFFLFVASLAFPTAFIKLRIYNLPLQIADIVFVISAVAWLAAYLTKRVPLVRSRFYIFLAAYAVAVVISTIASANPEFSSIKLIGKFYLIAIAVVAFNSIRTSADLRRTIKAFLIGAGAALVLSFAGLTAFYFGFTDPATNVVLHPIYGSLPPGNYRRIEGFFYYPAMFANHIAVAWAFALLAFSAGWMKMRVFVPFTAVLLIIDAFTLTPGSGGIFLTTAYFLQAKLSESGRQLFGRAVMAGGILAAAAFFTGASITVFTPDGNAATSGNISPSHRAVAWKTAFDTFLKEPLTGRGVGLPVADSRFTDPSGNRQVLTDAHNTYVSLLAETGILGFAAFIGMIAFLTIGLYKLEPGDTIGRMARICFLLALCDAFFYQSLTGSYEDTRHLWLFFGMIAAVLVLHSRDPDDVPELNH